MSRSSMPYRGSANNSHSSLSYRHLTQKRFVGGPPAFPPHYFICRSSFAFRVSILRVSSHPPATPPGAGPGSAHSVSSVEVARMTGEALDALFAMDVPLPHQVHTHILYTCIYEGIWGRSTLGA